MFLNKVPSYYWLYCVLFAINVSENVHPPMSDFTLFCRSDAKHVAVFELVDLNSSAQWFSSTGDRHKGSIKILSTNFVLNVLNLYKIYSFNG